MRHPADGRGAAAPGELAVPEISVAFSITFHKEDSSSTVSAQAHRSFLLLQLQS
jgi:hypothetical protein